MWALVGSVDSQFSVVVGKRTLSHTQQTQAGEELWEAVEALLGDALGRMHQVRVRGERTEWTVLRTA
jgi:hypothetical protein